MLLTLSLWPFPTPASFPGRPGTPLLRFGIFPSPPSALNAYFSQCNPSHLSRCTGNFLSSYCRSPPVFFFIPYDGSTDFSPPILVPRHVPLEKGNWSLDPEGTPDRPRFFPEKFAGVGKKSFASRKGDANPPAKQERARPLFPKRRAQFPERRGVSPRCE